MVTIEDVYQQRLAAGDAMAGHMKTLRTLAEECQVCVEFGIRRANSSAALLAGCRGVVHSYDIEIYPKGRPIVERLQAAAGDKWRVHLQNSVTADVPPCDLLLHDSLHNYYQVLMELDAHGDKVRKYIVFHDIDSHGEQGHSPNNWARNPQIKGIRPAIEKWMSTRPEWQVKFEYKPHSGLLCLERHG